MTKPTGILHRSHENGFTNPMIASEQHMSAYSCLGMRSAFHWRGFETPSGQWLEVFWTVDQRTGQVTDIFEDTRGLNRK